MNKKNYDKYDNIAILGNKDFKEHLPTVFARCKECLEAGELADMSIEIDDYLPPEDSRGAYQAEEIQGLKTLVSEYESARFPENVLVDVVAIVTGKEWEIKTIRGYCQSDWVCVCYPVGEWTNEDIRLFEIEYFDMRYARNCKPVGKRVERCIKR